MGALKAQLNHTKERREMICDHLVAASSGQSRS
jgi:hypothetical protein